MKKFKTDSERWEAVLVRDPCADGRFFYGVETTGIYCRPVCPSRRPNRANARFFDTAEKAEAAGFRPCKRCQPGKRLPEAVDPQKEAILKACDIIKGVNEPLSLDAIAVQVGFSPHHFQRLFKKIVGISPKQYSMEVRLQRFRTLLQEGSPVTQALYAAGFESNARLYETASATLGMKPSAFGRGAPEIPIRHAVVPCFLGWSLVAATEKGVCLIAFDDNPEKLRKTLRHRFPKAEFVDPKPGFEDLIALVLARIEAPDPRNIDLPLDVRGTAFQRRVWRALQEIPPGATRTYAQIAGAIGQPAAARAVANACGANPVAVLVPCHRVVRTDGRAGGYHWGRERKKRLLDRESRQEQ